MRELPTAVAFLTRIPVPVSWTGGAETVGRSARYFPLVGLLLGGAYWGLAHIPLPAFLVAVIIVIAEAFLTGALHMDGLADMGDGFGGGQTREDVLRIMKDHQIGAYGAVALLLMLLLKTGALAELIATGKLWPLVIAPCVARWATVWMSYRGPYARPSGKGAVANFVRLPEVLIATALALIAAGCWRDYRVLLTFVPTIACAEFILRWSRGKIGGVTGDVIGATTAIAETLILVTAVKL